jgi:hypothetical protein
MSIMRFIILPATAVLIASCAGASNNEIQMAQERSACAQLGIDPGSQGFAQCVGNLDASMFEAGPGHQR